MEKTKVFYILFFILYIFELGAGCAKNIETASSSMGLEEAAVIVSPVKENKDATSTLGGTTGKKEETGRIIEESASKDTTSDKTALGNKIDHKLIDIVPQTRNEIKPLEEKVSLPLKEMKPQIKEEKEELATGMPVENIGSDTDKEIPFAGDKDIEAAINTDFDSDRNPGSRSIDALDEAKEAIHLDIGSDEEKFPVPDKEIHLAKEETGEIIEEKGKEMKDASLKDIFFDFDIWTLKEEVKVILEENARYLMSNPGINIKIEGHADERGTDEYNLLLGERRARSAMNFLVDMGVDKERISIISLGEERGFCSDHDESCWSFNRRGHFLVIDSNRLSN